MNSPADPASMQVIIIDKQTMEIKDFNSQSLDLFWIDNFLQGDCRKLIKNVRKIYTIDTDSCFLIPKSH